MDHKFLSSFLAHLEGYGQKFELIAERFYSRVYRTPGRIMKVITPHLALRPEGFRTKSEASSFGTEILTYMEKLAELGVPVSSVADTHITISSARETGEPFILMDVSDSGVSVEVLLTCASVEFLRELARGMVNAILCVLYQSRLTDGYPEVGLDPIASNFVLQGQDCGTMVYVDFTAPRYFSHDAGYRVEYPQPSSAIELYEAAWLYYDSCGIVSRWLIDCCRIRPDARRIFLEILGKSLPVDLWKCVQERLPSLWFAEGNWKSAFESVRGTVDLRDMACAIAATDGTDPVATRVWLQKFFEDSRHHPGQPFPDEKLGALQAQLMERLSMI